MGWGLPPGFGYRLCHGLPRVKNWPCDVRSAAGYVNSPSPVIHFPILVGNLVSRPVIERITVITMMNSDAFADREQYG